MALNRKNQSFTLDVKIKSLEDIMKGVPASKIAADLQCNPSTVRAWKKQQDSIKDFMKIHTKVTSKKRIRKIENNRVGEAIWIWFQQNRAKGIPLSGPLIRAQALKFHEALRESKDFQASEGWLSKWKKRYNIRCVSICGEKFSAADQAAAEKYKATLLDFITKEELIPDQVFNCDETGLYYKMLLQKTLAATTEKGASDMKGNKERVTIMACSNASGSLKLPLMVIGKSAKPRALKDTKILPVYYKNQSSSWMTSDLFESWFYEEFVPKVNQFLMEKKLPLKAILLMDNCRAHPNLRRDNIQTVFLPANTIALIQPMDQGMLKCLKINYRKKLMFSLLENLNNGGNLNQYLKNINIKEVIFRIATAWDELPATTIAKSWNQLWPREYMRNSNENIISAEESITDDDMITTYGAEIQEFHHLLENQNITIEDVNEWLTNPKEMELSDEEIINMVSHNEENNDPSETEINCTMSEISNSQAKDAINIIIQYCDQNSNYSTTDIIALHRIKDLITYEAIQNNRTMR